MKKQVATIYGQSRNDYARYVARGTEMCDTKCFKLRLSGVYEYLKTSRNKLQ